LFIYVFSALQYRLSPFVFAKTTAGNTPLSPDHLPPLPGAPGARQGNKKGRKIALPAWMVLSAIKANPSPGDPPASGHGLQPGF
jgi:hypothetical protein